MNFDFLLNISSHLTFTHGLFPSYINSLVQGGWSVAVEILFYLFIPFLFNILKNTTDSFLALILSISVSTLSNLLAKNIWGLSDEYLYFWFPSQLPVFLMGVLVFFYIKNETKKKIICSHFTLLILTLLLLTFFKLISLFILKVYIISLAMIIFVIFVKNTNPVYIANKMLCEIGTISYSIYLVHFSIIYSISILFVFDNGIYFIPVYFMVVLLSIFIGKFSYKFIEVPGIRIGNVLISNISTKK